ncbi:MAG: hypothetical protein B6I19_07140 [Bacteroidetes bacterium 4572_114]|nr:MAG: hypothetical protein B6I19_07140 [Bacteroidetes bacterium 4572_114]
MEWYPGEAAADIFVGGRRLRHEDPAPPLQKYSRCKAGKTESPVQPPKKILSLIKMDNRYQSSR